MTMKSAPPSCFPLCTLFNWMKPSTTLWTSQTPEQGSSIQWPVTAKYPSVFEACHTSHVKLISPWTRSLCSNMSVSWKNQIESKPQVTFKWVLRSSIHLANISRISSQVILWLGMVTLLAACDVSVIILQNFGCSKAWIGWSNSWLVEIDGDHDDTHTSSVVISHSIAASWNAAFE